jgi:FRG domain
LAVREYDKPLSKKTGLCGDETGSGMEGMNARRVIKGIEEFITAVREDSSAWKSEEPKWFRGEPESTTALVPTLYRPGPTQHENALLQMFRARASGYHDALPIREHTDQWLFLARHAGLPTRLLDWSESALIGLFFALKEDRPIIWMLNPLELNELSYASPSPVREFPLVWHNPRGATNPAFENLRGAWENDGPGVQLPLAIHPTYVHPRLRSQRSCFTIHGKRKSGLDRLVPQSILRRYVVDPACRQSMINEVALLGITDSVVFPDLDGLATELKERFGFRCP